MRAAKVATKLRTMGFPVLQVTEGGVDLDGVVEVAARVHVSVPTYRGAPSATLERRDGSFLIYPDRRDYTDLAADLRAALAEA